MNTNLQAEKFRLGFEPLIRPDQYGELTEQIIEIKRMLTVLVQKLNADSWLLIARGQPESPTLVAATGRAMRYKWDRGRMSPADTVAVYTPYVNFEGAAGRARQRIYVLREFHESVHR